MPLDENELKMKCKSLCNNLNLCVDLNIFSLLYCKRERQQIIPKVFYHYVEIDNFLHIIVGLAINLFLFLWYILQVFERISETKCLDG